LYTEEIILSGTSNQIIMDSPLRDMKKSGEGVHIIWEILRKGFEYRIKQLSDWFNTTSCPKHGEAYIYTHGYNDNVDCFMCHAVMINRHDKKECKYCGFEYVDPKFCSVSGRTVDKHKWL